MPDIDNILKIVLLLIGFLAILFLTYVTTRYIAQKQNKTMRGKNISVMETVMLGTDKKLHLVKAGSSYVLIASTSKSVEFMSTVEMDESEAIEDSSENMDNRFDFKAILEKYSGMYRAKKQRSSPVNNEGASDQVNGDGFKTNLERLKTIINNNKHKEVKKDGVEVTNDK
jgi:flagellar biogenesis protein FliO